MTTLRGLFMRYYEVRESLGAPKTSMPQPESLKREVFVSNPQQARDSIEYQWAFLCDVELYLDRIDWFDRVVIEGKIPAFENEDGRPFPKRYKNPGNLSKFFGEVIKPNAEAYFRDRGYLR
jgi:hypothetical protein